MQPFVRQTLQALEWDRFLDLASEEARTLPAKQRVLALASPENWAQDIASARILQQETQELGGLLDRDGIWGPLSGLADLTAALESLRKGGVLELAQLSAIRGWLYAIDSWSQIPREEIRAERFRKALATLPDPTLPLRLLERVLTPEGELSERASPKLASLYSEIRSLKKEIDQVLDHLLKTFSQKGVLQEVFSDVRDGRYVIPVKISSQNEIDGIIYEASASRQTVFVEPKEVAPLNNRLRQRQNEVIQETFRILEETSRALGPYADELESSSEIIVHWDLAQARARTGLHFGGKTLQITEERRFSLSQTAHPLLWKSLEPVKIIRNQVELQDPARTLLITGPNTGGKTVLLKTLGLAGVCARTGFPFPSTGQPLVPFFDSFFADLGDPQSLEQHLSSFSGHIFKFKEILEHSTDRSLILLDELNTATDPEEGAALGRAFLETLMGRGAMIVSTTHDPHLKALAINDSRILNASMAFDESARTPTFRIVLGVPGRSRALETAERLGIPTQVLTLAKSYLSTEHKKFEATLSQLERDLDEAAKAKREAVHIREEAEKIRKEWTDRTEASVGELMDRTRQKLRRILELAQDEVRATVRKLDEARSRKDLDTSRTGINEIFTKSASRIDSALKEEAPDLAETLEQERAARGTQNEPEPEAEKPKIEVGKTVRIPKWKNTGTVLEINGNKAKVAMGSLQMQLSLSDLEPLWDTPSAAQLSGSSQKKSAKSFMTDQDRPSAPPSRLDLRGMRYDVAMSALEKYLDQAFRSGALAEVTIVHGLGTGALREGAREMLKGLPYVKEFRDGGPGQGGTGATLVEFER